MRIDESRVFVFQFETNDMGGITFPMRAESREIAAEELKKVLAKIQLELVMEFPVQSPRTLETALDTTGVDLGGIPYDVLEMRIDTLLGDLGAKNMTPEARSKTVKEWTDIEFKPENFTRIITDLELIASGQKEVPLKPKKK